MKFKEFLNPKSMMTPAIAGSFIMIIANTLWLQFAISQKWTALFLSFLFLVPVLKSFTASFLERSIYFIFNALIVFSMAVNTNYAGKVLSEFAKDTSNNNTPLESSAAANSDLWFIKNAYAQEEDVGKKKTTNDTEILERQAPADTAHSDSKKDKANDLDSQKTKRKFFEPWLD